MRKWIMIGFGIVVAGIAAVWLAGAMLPQQHVLSRTAVFHASTERVWEVIADPPSFPQWRRGLKSVEMLAPRDGLPAWVEEGGDGRVAIEVVESAAPRRMVTRIADPDLPFGGTWTYELETQGEGTRLTITERGEVYNPIFRLLSRYVFGHSATLEQYLTDLGKRFGQDVRF